MSKSPAIGFVGFGEAGFNIAKGMRGAGVAGICAFDINTQTPVLGEKIQRRAHRKRRALGLLQEFGGKPPADYKAVVHAIFDKSNNTESLRRKRSMSHQGSPERSDI
ncbi:MAG: hypothetical protein ACREDR_16350 [Blastocatellia bacterium]